MENPHLNSVTCCEEDVIFMTSYNDAYNVFFLYNKKTTTIISWRIFWVGHIWSAWTRERCSKSGLIRLSKKIVVSRPECFQKGGGRYLLFAIFIIFTISYLLVNYGSLGKITSIYACQTITIHTYGHDCFTLRKLNQVILSRVKLYMY